ncbi:MAG: transcriptional repressor [Sulfurimonas sp.]|nr:MAG: transcriptional repressor [Sulfurimonas sp.]
MNFEYLIKTHNLKVTAQRVSILENMNNYGHINIDELFLEVKKNFNNISLATLYKNINLMIKNSLIKEVKIASYKSKYEIKKDTHAHILCTVCNEFEDLDFNCSLAVDNVEKTTAYKIDNSEFIFSGICQKCQ